MPDVRIGTAGWSIPRESAHRFEAWGTHLERYARSLRCVEVNSSFYRPHRIATYERWRDSTPADFRFAVKMPRTITHEQKLQNARGPLAAFLAQTSGLREKRGPVLVQLPPSLAFDPLVVPLFLEVLRELYDGPVVCEPRHATWFTPVVTALLVEHRVARVATDPPPVAAALVPAAWPRLAYFRLHGSPRMYWSRYEADRIAALASTIRTLPDVQEVWCVFDNTACGAAMENAWELRSSLRLSRAFTLTRDRDRTDRR